MAQEKLGFGKAIIIAIISLVVVMGVFTLLGIVKWPTWYLLMAFTCFSVVNFDFSKLHATIGGALLGTMMGFGANLLNLALSPITQNAALISQLIFAGLVIIMIACLMTQKFPLFVNPNTVIFMTVGLIPETFDLKFLVPYYGELIIFSIIFLLIGYVLKTKASRNATQA